MGAAPSPSPGSRSSGWAGADARRAADRVVDLEGRLVLPGFTDAHTHLLMMGAALGQVYLTGARSLDDILRLLRGGACRRPRTRPSCAAAAGSSTRCRTGRRRRP